MKILLLHNRYKFVGGEDGVVQVEKSLLEKNGHQVFLLEVNNDDIKSPWSKITAAASAIYSYPAKQQVSKQIISFSPDVAHVHNFFPLLSPSVYDACQEHKVPVVQTLHNYRLACPKAIPFRDGKVCENCIGKSIPWDSILYGCYRDSRIESSVVTAMNTWHKWTGTWQKRVDAYIALTNFQKEKMIQAGLPGKKIYVKPNFIFTPQNSDTIKKCRDFVLFVGRLSEEKGVSVLIDAYLEDNLSIPLKIVGDGPLREKLQQKIRNTKLEKVIEFLGFQKKHKVLELMQEARCLVFPSVWYEGFPLTIAEAFACGLPVIAPKLGSMADIVDDVVTGLHFQSRNHKDLAAKIEWIISNPKKMRDMSMNARKKYAESYTPETNYKQLISIYRRVIH